MLNPKMAPVQDICIEDDSGLPTYIEALNNERTNKQTLNKQTNNEHKQTNNEHKQTNNEHRQTEAVVENRLSGGVRVSMV